MTDRQYWAWQAHRELELNQPNRDNYYTMRVSQQLFELTAVVATMMGGTRPQTPALDKFILPFEVRKPEEEAPVCEDLPEGFPKRLTRETVAEAERHIALARIKAAVQRRG